MLTILYYHLLSYLLPSTVTDARGVGRGAAEDTSAAEDPARVLPAQGGHNVYYSRAGRRCVPSQKKKDSMGL
jgi:hypothetical protein